MSHRSRWSRLPRVLAVAGAIVDAIGNAVGAYVVVCGVVVLGYLFLILFALAGGTVVAVLTAAVLLKSLPGGTARRSAGRCGRSGLLTVAAGLLPGPAGIRYREEWLGELYDLGAEGAPWRSQARYVLGVLLYAAPRLAVTMRLHPARAVD